MFSACISPADKSHKSRGVPGIQAAASTGYQRHDVDCAQSVLQPTSARQHLIELIAKLCCGARRVVVRVDTVLLAFNLQELLSGDSSPSRTKSFQLLQQMCTDQEN